MRYYYLGASERNYSRGYMEEESVPGRPQRVLSYKMDKRTNFKII